MPAVTVLLEAERVADGDHPVADRERVGVAERRPTGSGCLALDLEHGEVGLRVAAEHLGGQLAAVAQRDGDLLGVLDHVVVGEHDAVGADDEAGAGAALRPARRRAGRAAARKPRNGPLRAEGAVVVAERAGRERRIAPRSRRRRCGCAPRPAPRAATMRGERRQPARRGCGRRRRRARGPRAAAACAGSVCDSRPAAKPPAPRQTARAPASARSGSGRVHVRCPPVGWRSLLLDGGRGGSM